MKRLDESFSIDGWRKYWTGKANIRPALDKIKISSSGQIQPRGYMEFIDKLPGLKKYHGKNLKINLFNLTAELRLVQVEIDLDKTSSGWVTHQSHEYFFEKESADSQGNKSWSYYHPTEIDFIDILTKLLGLPIQGQKFLMQRG